MLTKCQTLCEHKGSINLCAQIVFLRFSVAICKVIITFARYLATKLLILASVKVFLHATINLRLIAVRRHKG